MDEHLSTLSTASLVTCLRFSYFTSSLKNCACHKTIEAVVRHGCTEIILHPSQCTEGAFRADICSWHSQNNFDQEHGLWYEGPDIFVLFEEIDDIMQCITSFTLPGTVIGLCQYR